MILKEYVILAPQGLHARPATTLLKLAKKFKSDVYLQKGEKKVQIKSMLNIIAIGAKCGDSVSITINGDDETDAALALDVFFTEEIKTL